MEPILRGATTYLFVWLIFRIAGKRSLAQITTFDAVLLLIVSEATEAALTDMNHSMTNSFLLIMTLLGIDVLLSFVKQWSPRLEHAFDGAPLVIMDPNGLRQEAMDKERIDREDILHAARELQGLPNLDRVEYAILEPSGGITIVAKRSA